MTKELSTTVVYPPPNERTDAKIQGFSSKETALILGLTTPAKASQAIQPAWAKVAMHARIDLALTIRVLLAKMNELPPMTDQELAMREAMQTGRLDRSVLHPNHR